MTRIKLTKRSSIITLIVITALGLGACTAHFGHPRHMNPEKIMKRATKKLDLNTEQQAKLQLVLETAADFKQNMHSKHDEFATPLIRNLSQPTIDVDELNTHFDALGTDLSQFRKTMIDQYAEFHASLDDQQRLKLAGFVEKMEKHRRH
jgi:uncharacterized membrane protein